MMSLINPKPQEIGIVSALSLAKNWFTSTVNDIASSLNPNSVLLDITGVNKSLYAAQQRVDTATTAYKTAQQTVSDLQAQGYKKDLSNDDPQGSMKAALAALSASKTELTKSKSALTQAQYNAADPETRREMARSGAFTSTPAKVSGSNSPSSSGPDPLSKSPISSYTFNLPPVKSTYFSDGGINSGSTRIYEIEGISGGSSGGSPQRQGTTSNLAPTKYQTAASAWVGSGRGRGAIQMSRDQMSFKADSGVKVDKTPYGFKFMYNPNTVRMTWGVPEGGMNYEFVFSGRDVSTAGSLGLMNSVIEFSILLNRQEDFTHIAGYGGGLKDPSRDPYLGGSNSKERSMIYKKGTMYDMEYLFKVLAFPGGEYNRFIDGLKTNDIGWINPQPVELHLGDGLRYKVRVESLSVHHSMFNDRMVPIMSTVNIGCTRILDSGYSDWRSK